MGRQKRITVGTVYRRQWLRDYAHVRIKQWPCSPIGQFVKN